MSTTVTETLLTAEELYCLPEPPNAGKIELIRGRVIIDMPVSGKHGQRQIRIGGALDQFLEGRSIGEAAVETGFILRRNPDVVLAPDVSMTLSERLPGAQLPENGFVDGPPSLAVEVVSPDDSEARVHAKVGEYLEAGSDRVWVVQAKTQTVIVYFAGGAVEQLGPGDALTSRHAGFPVDGFSLPIDTIFA